METVTITATNTKNAESGESCIYITNVYLDAEITETTVTDPGEWYWQGSWFIWKPSDSGDKGPHTIQLSIPAGRVRAVEFLTNKWKGIAEVTYGDLTQTADCYSAEESVTRVYLPDSSESIFRSLSIQQGIALLITGTIMNLLLFLVMFRKASEANGRRKRNASLEFFRFVMSIIVIVHHFRGFTPSSTNVAIGGYLCVDVFFIISGFFLMMHFDSHSHDQLPGQDAVNYLTGRLHGIIPAHIVAWIPMIFVALHFGYISQDDFLKKSWAELLLLKASGLGNDVSVNGVTWYLSALMINSYLIYFLLGKNRHNYLYLIAPLCFLTVMGYFYNEFGMLNRWTQSNTGFLADGFWRGNAEMGIGCVTYAVYTSLNKKVTVTRRMQFLATIGEGIGWAFVLYQMWGGHDHRDFLVPIVAIGLILSMFTCNSYLTQLLNNDFSLFLGKLSFPLYLNQLILLRPLAKLKPKLPFTSTTILLCAALILLSLCTDWIVQKITPVMFPARKKAN